MDLRSSLADLGRFLPNRAQAISRLSPSVFAASARRWFRGKSRWLRRSSSIVPRPLAPRVASKREGRCSFGEEVAGTAWSEVMKVMTVDGYNAKIEYDPEIDLFRGRFLA